MFLRQSDLPFGLHEIIDAYDDGMQLQSKKMEKNKREKRRSKANNNSSKGSADNPSEAKTKSEVSLTNGGQSNASAEHRRANSGDDSSRDEEEYGGEKGAVRRI
nr:uncharacterized protein LOC105175287 [Ipomoea batatas]GMD87153.1 uncharacterized protein LOC105175287 [Ipomoea batatas]